MGISCYCGLLSCVIANYLIKLIDHVNQFYIFGVVLTLQTESQFKHINLGTKSKVRDKLTKI